MMGRSTGFEPATSGTTNRRSNQLSYDRHTSLPEHNLAGCCQARASGARFTQGTRPVKCGLGGREPLAQRLADGKRKLFSARLHARFFRAA